MPTIAEGSGIDLELRGPDGRTYNGEVLHITVENIAPGDTGTKTVRIANVGTTTGHELDINIRNVTSTEGRNVEPETDTDTSNGGELDDQLGVRAIYRDDRAHAIIGDGSGDSAGFVNFTRVRDTGHHRIGGLDLSSGSTADGGEYTTLTFQYRFLDLPTNNDAMGDTVSFDTVITLSQNTNSGCQS